MSPEDTVALEVVTARLNGHDPKEWFNPELAAMPVRGNKWIVVKKDSDLKYFKSEWEAWHFKRTGVMP